MTATLRVGVVGVGYVGLTTAVCLAERGHHTLAVDVDEAKVRRLRAGESVIDEPDLPTLLRDGISCGALTFSTDYAGLADRDLVFVCVPTPGGPDGQADLRFVESAVDRLATVMRPGPGWGGSCLPKDTAALVHIANRNGMTFGEVEAARLTNAEQAGRIGHALRRCMRRPLAGAWISVLGLTFKAATSDTRESPALATCALLHRAGAHLVGYDPQLAGIDPDTLGAVGVIAVDEPYRATKAANAIVVLTEWPQFRELDWKAIACEAPAAVVLDTRNVLVPERVTAAGLTYLGNGVPGGF